MPRKPYRKFPFEKETLAPQQSATTNVIRQMTETDDAPPYIKLILAQMTDIQEENRTYFAEWKQWEEGMTAYVDKTKDELREEIETLRAEVAALKEQIKVLTTGPKDPVITQFLNYCAAHPKEALVLLTLIAGVILTAVSGVSVQDFIKAMAGN